MGYRFSSPRLTAGTVQAPGYGAVCGAGQVEVELDGQYLREFFLDDRGRIKDEVYSDEPRNETVRKRLTAPEGWMYVAEGVDERPRN